MSWRTGHVARAVRDARASFQAARFRRLARERAARLAAATRPDVETERTKNETRTKDKHEGRPGDGGLTKGSDRVSEL